MKGTPLLPYAPKICQWVLNSNKQQDIDAAISAYDGGQKSLERLLKTLLQHNMSNMQM